MKNKKYWQERAAWNMYDSMGTVEGIADEVAKVYMQSSRISQFQMENIFEKYKKEHRLSDAEARLLLENADSMKVQELIRKLENGEKAEAKRSCWQNWKRLHIAARMKGWTVCRARLMILCRGCMDGAENKHSFL